MQDEKDLGVQAQAWGQRGRHDAGRALGGFLARAGLNTSEIGLFVEAVARAAGDPEWKDRRTAARDQAKAFNAGKHCYGFPKVKELFGENTFGAPFASLSFPSERSTALAESLWRLLLKSAGRNVAKAC
jgi:hypothetical protein